MKTFKLVVVPVLSALLLASCAGGPDTNSAGNTEIICVISGEDAAGGPTTEFMGQTVSFCCKRCLAKWDKMEDGARKEALAKLNQ